VLRVVVRRFLYPGLFLVLFVAVALVYVSRELPIYTWDSKGYWVMFMDYGALLCKAPLHGLNVVLDGVRTNDYNPLPAVLLLPFYLFFGGGRAAYISGLVLFYLFPACLLALYLFKKIVPIAGRSGLWFSAPFFFTVFLFMPFWGPTLRGLPDMIGMIPLIAAVLMITSVDFSSKLLFRRAVVLGLLLWAPFLLRRWYAYSIVTLYLTLPVLGFFLHPSRELSLSRLAAGRNLVLNFFVAGITSIFMALVFQGKLISRILTTDYTQIYSGYHGTFDYSLWGLCLDNGLLIVILAAWGLFFGLRYQRRTAVFTLFLAANLVISFLLFIRTQSPGIHHLIPFSFWILMLCLLGLFGVLVYLQGTSLAKPFVLLSVAGMSLIFLSSLFKLPVNLSGSLLLPAPCYPQRLDRIDNYYRMVKVLEHLTAKGERLAVFSSNGILSDDLLSTLSERRLDSHLIFSSQVDSRDGLRLGPFTARYVLVADPVQFHLRPEVQRVVGIPARLLLSGQGIGRAYRKLDYDFHLHDGVHAYLFEKTRPFTRLEIIGLLKEFYHFYPEWKTEYENGLAVSFLTAEISLGDVWGRFELADDRRIFAHPGQSRPTVVELDCPGGSLKVSSLCKASQPGNGVIITITELESDNSQTWQVGPGETAVLDLAGFRGRRIRMVIDNHGSPAYDSIFIEPLR
jgi:hypothetical protein